MKSVQQNHNSRDSNDPNDSSDSSDTCDDKYRDCNIRTTKIGNSTISERTTVVFPSPQIIFYDTDIQVIEAYHKILQGHIPNTLFINTDLETLVCTNGAVNCLVSASNTYGDMFDNDTNRVIEAVCYNKEDSDYGDIETRVKAMISRSGIDDGYGNKHLPNGKCFITLQNNYYVMVAPTLTKDEELNRTLCVPNNIVAAFGAILQQLHVLTQQKRNITVACPCLGINVGRDNTITPEISAQHILNAYRRFGGSALLIF